jgi:nitric oxide reductase NorQ protein/cobaltochelatase CobS
MATVTIGGIAVEKRADHPTLKHLVPSPEEYEVQGREMQALALGDKHHRPVILVGETGTGKNAALREYARLTNRPLITISMAAGTTSDQFIGVPMPYGLAGGGFGVKWMDGALPTAIKNGAILNLDELNASDDRTLMRLHDFAANDYRLNVYENPETSGVEVVSPYNAKGEHNGFMLTATMNPAESGKYSGAKILNEATLDRFLVCFMDYLGLIDPDKEATVISRAAKVKVSKARRIVDVMNVIRRRSRMSDEDLAKNNSQPIFATASTRRAIDIALASKDVPIMAAVELAFVNKINADDQPVVHKLFLDTFASDSADSAEAA